MNTLQNAQMPKISRILFAVMAPLTSALRFGGCDEIIISRNPGERAQRSYRHAGFGSGLLKAWSPPLKSSPPPGEISGSID